MVCRSAYTTRPAAPEREPRERALQIRAASQRFAQRAAQIGVLDQRLDRVEATRDRLGAGERRCETRSQQAPAGTVTNLTIVVSGLSSPSTTVSISSPTRVALSLHGGTPYANDTRVYDKKY